MQEKLMAKQNFNAGLYLRLSKDDETLGESSSISTQRSILQDFCKSQDIIVFDEYIDDGYSGTNYERPGFLRMIADIENGIVNCVITKDLSRLGRNSARTSDLLDEYFPSHNVRYIAVIEGYDSFRLTNGNIMTAPVMLFMNEMYARDISNKIRTSFRSKMENGEFIGSFAPYGYKKDETDKNHLVVDYAVSGVVKEIFEKAAGGNSPKQIADSLNLRGIVTPAVYRCIQHPYINPNSHTKRREWTASGICKLLKNKVYLGHTIQGKTTKVSFKSKETKTNSESKWIEVLNTHEAIISEEMYDSVRKRSVSRRCPPTKGFHNIFSGIAKCADCGRNMTTAPTKKKGSIYNLCCGGYKTYGTKECSNHFIDYNMLYDVVFADIKKWLALTKKDRENIISALNEKKKEKPKNDMFEKRADEVTLLMKKTYEDYTFGRISEQMYNRLLEEYENEYASLESSIENNKQEELSYKYFSDLLEQLLKPEALSVDLLKRLIEKISVEQGIYEKNESGEPVKKQKIKIYYKFKEGKTP